MRALASDLILSKVLVQEGTRTEAVQTAHSDDSILMSRLQQGDGNILEILFDRYSRVVLGVGLRILRDLGEAQELVQDVFFYLHRKCSLYNPAKGSLRSWLIQIAYHRAFDRREHLQLRQFYNGASLCDRAQLMESKPSGAENPFDFAFNEEALRRAFDELSERQRSTLELYFFEGYTLREISERLGDSLANTRHHYYRALERLRRSALVKSLRPR